ncbi:MAG: radical SAM protein [Coriobacteriia bacterium]|nr:radical SAM protein [Coriobacteriia bacterium]
MPLVFDAYPYSTRPVTEVIQELQTIPQQEVYIVDDNFLFDRKRLLEFCEQLESHKIDKHFLVYGRADFIAANDDIIERLARNGLSAVIVWLESASQDELDSYNKRTKVDDNVAAVQTLKRHGIECYATVILGLDWDKADFQRLYRFLRELDVVFANLQPFTPLPGTEYFEYYQSQLLVPFNQPEKWDMAHLVVKPGKLSVRQYYAQIIKLYYRLTVAPKSTAYILRRYGTRQTFKLSLGALRITWQYVAKMIRG